MPREIKFRAWEEQGRKMIEPFHFIRTGIEGNDWIIWGRNYHELKANIDNPFFSQQLKIMQFTGLLDKNKKEIYEGDIVCVFDEDDDPYFFHEVVYRNGSFGYERYLNPSEKDTLIFHAFSSNGHFCWEGDQSDEIKVIGNIYEHHNILKPNTINPTRP